jgi:hypothetical protein
VYLHITADSVQLAEPEDVTDFYATCPATLGHDDLAASVNRADVGELLPGDSHLMISLDALRRMAADRVGPAWSEDFRKMIDYAASKGWVNENVTRVRAHLERS